MDSGILWIPSRLARPKCDQGATRRKTPPKGCSPQVRGRAATALLPARRRSLTASDQRRRVSPRGGLVLCEDGGGEQWLRGMSRSGQIFDFARNLLNDNELAGACFSPDGHTLFVNIQGATEGDPTDAAVMGSGVTLAIWGPWATGAL